MYILVHKKQEISKTKVQNLLKRGREEAVRKVIQLFHIIVAKSYQDTTVR